MRRTLVVAFLMVAAGVGAGCLGNDDPVETASDGDLLAGTDNLTAPVREPILGSLSVNMIGVSAAGLNPPMVALANTGSFSLDKAGRQGSVEFRWTATLPVLNTVTIVIDGPNGEAGRATGASPLSISLASDLAAGEYSITVLPGEPVTVMIPETQFQFEGEYTATG